MTDAMSVIDELRARGRVAWPGIEVPGDAFAAWVEQRSQAGELPHEDLYLACACARRDPSALRAFDAAFAADFDALHRRFPYLPSGADDIRQRVHEKLFVGEQPKIVDYAARGSLRAWLRVTVTRMLLNMHSREAREVPVAEEILRALPAPTDPEAAHLRKTQDAAFRAAFAEAVERIGYRDRNVLRYALVEGLGIDAIGKIHAVHRATAARWLGDAKDTLASTFRRTLKEQLGIGDSEVASLVRDVQSHIDLTLARYLAKK